MEYNGIKKLFALYQDDVAKAKMAELVKSYFYSLWRRVMNNGVVEPDTGTHFTTYVRKNHCRGFQVCSTCEILATDISQATNEDERESYRRALAEHHAEVIFNNSACYCVSEPFCYSRIISYHACALVPAFFYSWSAFLWPDSLFVLADSYYPLRYLLVNRF